MHSYFSKRTSFIHSFQKVKEGPVDSMGWITERGLFMCALLAVDVGLRTGLALFGRDGRLTRYWSRKLGTTHNLRRIVYSILNDLQEIDWLVLEGGGPLAEIWRHEAERRKIAVLDVIAEAWRGTLLYPRQQRNGASAKKNASSIARRVIDWSGAPRPTSLRHDTAESILIGFWGVLKLGWLERLPPEIR
jgi:hypothetical protein